MASAADLAIPFVVHGLAQFTVAMAQGFTIPAVASPKLALTCHQKTIGHAFLLWGTSTCLPYLTLGPTSITIAKYCIIGGTWASFVGDFGASVSGKHLPLASRAANVPCDPAEEDYSLPKGKRPAAKGSPAATTVLIKLSAVAIAVGAGVLLSGAPLSKAF